MKNKLAKLALVVACASSSLYFEDIELNDISGENTFLNSSVSLLKNVHWGLNSANADTDCFGGAVCVHPDPDPYDPWDYYDPDPYDDYDYDGGGGGGFGGGNSTPEPEPEPDKKQECLKTNELLTASCNTSARKVYSVTLAQSCRGRGSRGVNIGARGVGGSYNRDDYAECKDQAEADRDYSLEICKENKLNLDLLCR